MKKHAESELYNLSRIVTQKHIIAARMSQSCISLFLWKCLKCLKVTQCCIPGEMAQPEIQLELDFFLYEWYFFKNV